MRCKSIKTIIYLGAVILMLDLASANSFKDMGKLTQDQRERLLESYFSPKISTHLKITRHEKNKWMKSGGEIIVTPPKNQCFTITRNEELDDDVVCKRTILRWNIDQLDHRGRLKWIIKAGPNDFGSTYSWNSKLRVAELIRPGGYLPERIPVVDCVASNSQEEGERTITAQLVNGETIRIEFPDKDVSTGVRYKVADLAVGDADKAPTRDESNPIKKQPKPYKPGDAWYLQETNSFEMSSDRLRMKGQAPRGMRGKCRYQFDGSPDDHTSGWIECKDNEDFDHISMPLICSGSLKPKTKDTILEEKH